MTLYDKWLYVLKNLSALSNRPKTLRDKVFERLFEEAEILPLSSVGATGCQHKREREEHQFRINS